MREDVLAVRENFQLRPGWRETDEAFNETTLRVAEDPQRRSTIAHSGIVRQLSGYDECSLHGNALPIIKPCRANGVAVSAEKQSTGCGAP